MYEIRNARPQDALGITIVNSFAWRVTYTGLVPDSYIDQRTEELLPRMEKTRQGIEQGGHYLVATEENTVVGFCIFGPERDAETPGRSEIYALYVLPGYQKRGAGSALLSAALGALKEEGASRVIVNCLQGNPALRFYQRMGGKTIEQWSDDSSGFMLSGDTLLFELTE
ncbi:MAG TPA: GNAT family N-acetyltransferase [Candidatus Limiplasma sp.]|nr:GNAT family N-acetyltransferase [Candidatus Limiplasma sp.]